jgi:hypothetical protein
MTPTKDDEQRARLIPIVFSSSQPRNYGGSSTKTKESVRALLVLFLLRHLVQMTGAAAVIQAYIAAGWPVLR